ncbi:hypothetical protein CDAR_197741 [Caerostris darwini]|uniref:Uncharacterized protein n=1 Tax=Caerostris darwini TaxID=1538125 RepID=A0AAV4SDQ5_9ARAC|nr:hypothetical protein CDAR_197741 [Caerostris darwini]
MTFPVTPRRSHRGNERSLICAFALPHLFHIHIFRKDCSVSCGQLLQRDSLRIGRKGKKVFAATDSRDVRAETNAGKCGQGTVSCP